MPDTSSGNASSDEGNSNGKDNDVSPPPGFPPFYHAIPPGAVFVPPPANNNQSDYDEEDQSVYYPPPYSFHYQQDNATAVPPGPLVPGIILPPPPDFFSALEDKKATTKKQRRPETTPLPRPRPTYLPPRKLTTKRYKSTTTAIPIAKQGSTSVVDDRVTKVFGRITSRKNSTQDAVGTVRSAARMKLGTVPYAEVTTSTPDKSTTLENPEELYNVGPLAENQVPTRQRESEQKNDGWPGVVTGKTIPAIAYHATSTQSTLERPVEVTPASIKSIITTTGSPQRSHNGQASYYFYEESNDDEQSPLRTTPPNPVYYETTTESPFFQGKKKE